MIDAGEQHGSEEPDETELKIVMSVGLTIGKYITGKLEQVLDMQMTTLSDMQVGDLVIEIDLQVSIFSLVLARRWAGGHRVLSYAGVYKCCWFMLLPSCAPRLTFTFVQLGQRPTNVQP
jgi:hypothetical protein